MAKPVSIMIDTFGTAKYPNEKILQIIDEVFDFTPKGMINELNLLRPIYRKTSVYGHVGREEQDFTWESLQRLKEVQKKL